MPYIHARQPWKRQPVQPVEVDPSEISRGLVFVTLGAARVPLYPLNAAITRNGTTAVGVDTNGVSPAYNGTNIDIRLNVSVVGTDPAGATLFAFANTAQTAAEATIIGCSTSGSANPLFRLEQRNNGGAPQGWSAQFRDDVAALSTVSQNTALSVGSTAFVVGVYRSGSGQRELWVNGALAATDSTALGTITLTQTEVGTLVRAGAAQWFSGTIPLAGIYRRALNADAIAELSRNPWRIFKPLARRMYVNTAAAAGGPTYPQLERGIRGLNRGVALGSFH